MNGGIVPLLLLSATIGLMLAFLPARRALLALILFAIASVLGLAVPPIMSPDPIFAALWLSAIVSALTVYLPAGRWSATALPLCLNAGYWLGATASLAGDVATLALGMLPVLLTLPARWLAGRKLSMVIKVAASWLIAIASLSLFVSLVPTPGYKPDHME